METWIQRGHARFRDLKINDREAYEYLLGAFQGDGTSNKGTLIYTVDSRNSGYISNLTQTLIQAIPNCRPRVRYEKDSNVARVAIHSVAIVPKYFSVYKQNGVWSLPSLEYPRSYLAGVIDTDGCLQLRKNTATCRVVQKESSNIELLSKTTTELSIPHKLDLDRPYQNKLGNFERSELKISSQDNMKKILNLPYRNPKRKERCDEIEEVYKFLKVKRPDGELEKLILSHLEHPKTIAELVILTGCTQGNLNYKLLRMSTIYRSGKRNSYLYHRL